MLLPNFIEGVGNEVLISALTLGGILFCVGIRLYNNGIRIVRTQATTPTQSTNSNTESQETAVSEDSNENIDDYQAGVLDSEYMESLRGSDQNTDNSNLLIFYSSFQIFISKCRKIEVEGREEKGTG